MKDDELKKLRWSLKQQVEKEYIAVTEQEMIIEIKGVADDELKEPSRRGKGIGIEKNKVNERRNIPK